MIESQTRYAPGAREYARELNPQEDRFEVPRAQAQYAIELDAAGA